MCERVLQSVCEIERSGIVLLQKKGKEHSLILFFLCFKMLTFEGANTRGKLTFAKKLLILSVTSVTFNTHLSITPIARSSKILIRKTFTFYDSLMLV